MSMIRVKFVLSGGKELSGVGGSYQTLLPLDSTDQEINNSGDEQNYLCNVALVNQEAAPAVGGERSVMEYPPFAICSLAHLRWERNGSTRPEASFSLAPPSAKITKSHLQTHKKRQKIKKHHNVVHFHRIYQNTHKQTNLVLVGVS